MPRVSEAEKRKSHVRILAAASRLIRENGLERTSVADVMTAAGMTHGGFYRHFQSKEDLVAAAFRNAVDGIVADIETAETPEARRAAREAYIDRYLSAEHVSGLGEGCPLAAIGQEANRGGDAISDAAAESVHRMARLLDPASPSEPADTYGRGMAIMALLLGTVTLARQTADPEQAEAVLAAGRHALRAMEAGWNAADRQAR